MDEEAEVEVSILLVITQFMKKIQYCTFNWLSPLFCPTPHLHIPLLLSATADTEAEAEAEAEVEVEGVWLWLGWVVVVVSGCGGVTML